MADWRVAVLLGAAGLGALPGCGGVQGRVLTSDEQIAFRAEAVQFLKDSAFSYEPVETCQAIEAWQDAAPDEGVQYIVDNLDTGHSMVTFAALMALGKLKHCAATDRMRTFAESADRNVRVAALYALHRCGSRGRTTELASLLIADPNPRVRANAALAIGQLGEPSSITPLRAALRRQEKNIVTFQVYEGLAALGDRSAINWLLLQCGSAVQDQALIGIMALANAGCAEAHDAFVSRLSWAEHPEIKLHAARGLGKLGSDRGMELALAHLFFKSPEPAFTGDSPERRVIRVRALAALALEAIGRPEALGPLRDAFHLGGQHNETRIAIARAAIILIDRQRGRRPGLPEN